MTGQLQTMWTRQTQAGVIGTLRGVCRARPFRAASIGLLTAMLTVSIAESLTVSIAESLAESLAEFTSNAHLAQDASAQEVPNASQSDPAPPKPAILNMDEERAATFFMGRIRYSKNDGNDCSRVGENLVKLVAQVSTIQVQRERVVAFNDPRLFTTPFLFMNGHNDFQLSNNERSNLRNYFQRGGFLLASGCCTNPGFPAAFRREFSQILPGERVRRLSYDHPIYRSFYKLSRIRCLHEPRDIYLEGLFERGRLVAVLCEDGLCCAFSMDNLCNQDQGVSPEDGRKLALNIAVYSLTH